MTLTEQFIARLEALGGGERSRLRGLAGQPLHQTVPGFDLFTALWWPVRQAGGRQPSWLVAKLFGAFPLPPVRGESLPAIVGACEPGDEDAGKRWRDRFDALVQTPLSQLEPHLGWALSVAAHAVAAGGAKGMDWVRLLHDLSRWERHEEQGRKRDVRDIWAKEYLKAAKQPGRS